LEVSVIDFSLRLVYWSSVQEKNYPPAYQLALDMLKRLSATRKGVKDQIVEVLLTRHQLLPALRLIRNSELSVNCTSSSSATTLFHKPISNLDTITHTRTL
jgi:hypothetical protein